MIFQEKPHFSTTVIWVMLPLSMKIRASSLEIMDEVSADDRKKINDSMFGEVLQTSLYPEIRFAREYKDRSH